MQGTHTTGLHTLCKPCSAGSAGAGRTAMLNASLVSSEVNKGFQVVSTAGLENLLKLPITAVNTLPSSGQKNLRKPAIAAVVDDPGPEPPADLNAWRELAQAHHAHHFKCTTCIAAGRDAQNGLRCGVGAALWVNYQNT